MSEPARVLSLRHDQMELTIQFPKSKEVFDIEGKHFLTDLEMTPRLRVRLTGEGVIGKFTGDFTDEDGKMKWKVVLDEAILEAL